MDSSDKKIKSINPSTGQITDFVDLSEYVQEHHVFGLALSTGGVKLYVSVWGTCTILSVHLRNKTIETLMTHLGQEVLFSIATLQPAQSASGSVLIYLQDGGTSSCII